VLGEVIEPAMVKLVLECVGLPTGAEAMGAGKMQPATTSKGRAARAQPMAAAEVPAALPGHRERRRSEPEPAHPLDWSAAGLIDDDDVVPQHVLAEIGFLFVRHVVEDPVNRRQNSLLENTYFKHITRTS
jgi:hypothetical protein